MINKYDALDWQTFSQKKNIEEIARNTKDKNDIQLTAAIEIFMAIATLVLDNIFSGNLDDRIWFIILIISLIPIIRLLLIYVLRYVSQYRSGYDLPNPQDMIDLFDNDICYYVLMAESYSHEFKDLKNNNIKEFTSIEKFCFIETCFYIIKAIHDLYRMSGVIDKVFSVDASDLISNRKVSLTRLKNIFNILDGVIPIIEANFDMISDIDTNKNYYQLFQHYKFIYENFKNLITEFIEK